MIDPHFVILGALLSVAGALGYSRQTVLGHTRPNRVTWLPWALAPLIAFVAQLSDGVGLPAVLTFINAVRAPETEHHGVFRNATLNAAITLLAIQHWSFSAAVFPIYIFMMGGILYFLVRIRPQFDARRAEPVQ